MVLKWASRCLPGFSIIALMLLLVAAFPTTIHIPWWTSDLAAQKPAPSSHQGKHEKMSFAQKVFVVYFILVHLNMFVFTVRLCFSLFSFWRQARMSLQHARFQGYNKKPQTEHISDSTYASSISSTSFDDSFSAPSSPQPRAKFADVDTYSLEDQNLTPATAADELIHAIIVPNYCEDLHTLFTTLSVLASHSRARSQYEIFLAMEEKEEEAPVKAKKLMTSFGSSFYAIHTTFHPAGLPGEIAGKSSNVAYAARQITNLHRYELHESDCKVVITVMDADTHLVQEYFLEVRRLHYAHLDSAERSLYCCPILFDRNSSETPVLVRCADLMWGFAGISTMYPGTPVSIPTSVYSLPIQLANKVGGWDSGPTAIGEDMHMMLKCYFGTGGSVITRTVHVPASQCNVSSDYPIDGWRRTLDTCRNRYKQALRHMWGALDTGYALRKTMPFFDINFKLARLRPFLRVRHLALVHLLWEAHFLPCHLTILLVFSVICTFFYPVETLHPTLVWALSFANLIRTLSFIGMNINLVIYDQWHQIWLYTRRQDMVEANLKDCGFSSRSWWHIAQLTERICFPIAGTIYGAVAMGHAVFSHFWTNRLVYRVSKKPTFANPDQLSLA
ncbi:glycosyl transferase family group 2-domain-containing protein [Talaromyces proteolyticus]|uniref:Glycosyl transferase family group 2-domain-containing protein n=1 Tax=Talaromyces proteolyticus TaxID=1131652 RepID=A0AAD4KK83_9EURO|nr:glycosyl transferase family group 2-domain-containing protein [Talaromyces proteolyticus]KAH8691201.1 glycosyl transferase family group 2-domain-containing protein [Talaromyces proteolyticus]